jgi:hypothetical protein
MIAQKERKRRSSLAVRIEGSRPPGGRDIVKYGALRAVPVQPGAVALNPEAKEAERRYLAALVEKEVGEQIEQLLPDGWEVAHDLSVYDHTGRENANIDHLACNGGRVIMFDTKAWSGKYRVSDAGIACAGDTDRPWLTKTLRTLRYEAESVGAQKIVVVLEYGDLVDSGRYIRGAGEIPVVVIPRQDLPGLIETMAGRTEPATPGSLRKQVEDHQEHVSLE